MSEEERRRQAEKERNSKDDSPKDPAKELSERDPKEGGADQPERPDDVPAWVAMLPPEIRDALAGGEAEKIPARYRHLIQRYNLWLQRKQKDERR